MRVTRKRVYVPGSKGGHHWRVRGRAARLVRVRRPRRAAFHACIRRSAAGSLLWDISRAPAPLWAARWPWRCSRRRSSVPEGAVHRPRVLGALPKLPQQIRAPQRIAAMPTLVAPNARLPAARLVPARAPLPVARVPVAAAAAAPAAPGHAALAAALPLMAVAESSVGPLLTTVLSVLPPACFFFLQVSGCVRDAAQSSPPIPSRSPPRQRASVAGGRSRLRRCSLKTVSRIKQSKSTGNLSPLQVRHRGVPWRRSGGRTDCAIAHGRSVHQPGDQLRGVDALRLPAHGPYGPHSQPQRCVTVRVRARVPGQRRSWPAVVLTSRQRPPSRASGLLFGLYYTYVFASNTHLDLTKYYIGSGAIVSVHAACSPCALSDAFAPPATAQCGMVGLVALLYPEAQAATIIGYTGMTLAVLLMSSPLAGAWGAATARARSLARPQ
jgi:hypothetical protein